MRKFPVVKNIENISRFIESISMITCSLCGVKEAITLDAEEAAEQFVINGRWKATVNNVYCLKCSKKRLKIQH